MTQMRLALLAAGVLAFAATATGCFSPDKDVIKSPPNGVYYEIFVRSFADSNGDGIGDLRGATQKLDYLQELGIDGIWLMPINASPSYHGYDVTDYKAINPEYGTLDDLKSFLAEAHKREIKVLMDFVVNHTSREHPWFQDAVTNTNSPYRNYFLWEAPGVNLDATGEWGQPLWHGTPGNRYHSVFWEGMPDLNFDNPAVRKEMIEAGQFWLRDVGLDGFRLDAAKHIYEADHPEQNHAWWREFRTAMVQAKPDAFLVGEVWDLPDVVAPYLKDGLHSAFNFDLSKTLVSAAQNELDSDIATSLVRVREAYAAGTGNRYYDSIFLTNHDIDRVMSQLEGNVDHAKMAASMLLTLPGNPFLYYGEEIGMEGHKPDEQIREPFPWKKDPKAPEQTSWEPSTNNSDFANKSLEAQMADSSSLYNHYKTMIDVRRTSQTLTLGEIAVSSASASGVAAWKRTYEQETLLVLHNLTGQPQPVKLADDHAFEDVFFTSKEDAKVTDGVAYLPPYSTVILEK